VHGPGAAARAAFTLIELLVVVAIISLLLAVLLPAFQDARSQSKRLYCRNNLRNIWTGVIAYSLEFKDRVPYAEDINRPKPGKPFTGVNADPFDRQMPTTIGYVLKPYVVPENWVCPSAVNGYPFNAGRSGWKLTYQFSTADYYLDLPPTPYDSHPYKGSHSFRDPAINNYVHFDGRPLRLLDGRRYVSSPATADHVQTAKGWWGYRTPIIADLPLDESKKTESVRGFVYPHSGTLDRHPDLFTAENILNRNANIERHSKMTGRLELHADGDVVDVFFTRSHEQHKPGY
jgi:prepilin-type N-terminal cleavage/methylation domain-containing protein